MPAPGGGVLGGVGGGFLGSVFGDIFFSPSACVAEDVSGVFIESVSLRTPFCAAECQLPSMVQGLAFRSSLPQCAPWGTWCLAGD